MKTTTRAKTKKPARVTPKARRQPAKLLRTHVHVLLDRSASMSAVKESAVAGVNTFLAEQRKLPDKTTFTLVQFDDVNPFEMVQDTVAMDKAKDLGPEQFQPRGNTPLYDAIGKSILHIDNFEEAKGIERVFVVIQTDGQENVSKTFTSADIKTLIKKRRKAGWVFLFLGADMDAMEVGRTIGVPGGQCISNTSSRVGYGNTFGAAGMNINRMKAEGTAVMDFASEQRDAAMKGD